MRVASSRADGRRVPHRRMVRRREHEAEAELVDRPRDLLGRELELEPERLEHVGAMPESDETDAVAVFRDARAGGGRDERRRGRDVERLAAVAARAGGIDEIVALRAHGDHVCAHRLGGARDLVGRLALQAQRDQEAADLRRRRVAAT